jgi:hypothetical protein
VRVEILLSPELPPRVQAFALTSVPEPPPALRRAAERVLAAMDLPGTGPVTIDWPPDVVVSEALQLGPVVRAMRATEARFGPLELGPPIEGDGERKATFRLHGPRGRVDLALSLDPARGCIDSVALVPPRQVPPDLD